jgi:hypothetical protein
MFTSIFKGVALIICVHTCIFLGEYIYQRHCVHISLYGYLNMFFTNHSTICTNIRNANMTLQSLVCNIVFQIGSILYLTMEGYSKKVL